LATTRQLEKAAGPRALQNVARYSISLPAAEVVKHGRTQAYIEARLERVTDGALLAKETATNVFLDR
jgi:hypothetical protein